MFSSLSMRVPLDQDFFDLPGGRTSVLSTGRGPNQVIFFPAIGDSALNHVPLLRYMASQGLRVHAVDPPGYGQVSDQPYPSFNLLMMEWAEQLCRALPGPKLLVGNSVGAALATGGLTAPGVHGLVLVGWPVFVDMLPGPHQLMPRTAEELDQLLDSSWYSPPKLGPAAKRILLKQMLDKNIHDHAMSLDPYEYLERLFGFDGPVWFVAGRQDGLVPLDAMEQSVTAMPNNSRLVVVEKCGHYPHRERVKAFGAELAVIAKSLFKNPELLQDDRQNSEKIYS